MTTTLCPVCGNVLVGLDGCNACRTPSTAFPWPQSLPTDADEVQYDLSDLEPTHRAALTGLLRDNFIAYRFETGVVLVVAEPDEERVDEALREVEAPGEEELALAAAGDEDQVESDEAAMDALSALYGAADRLVRRPDSSPAADELQVATGAVTATAPPWGFDARLWVRIGDAATRLSELLEAGSLGDVISAAEEVRDLVRDHV